MSLIAITSTLAIESTFAQEGLTQKKIEDSMYFREGSQQQSLALKAKEEMQQKGISSEGERRIEVGTRPMAHCEFVEHQEKRALAADEGEQAPGEALTQANVEDVEIAAKNIDNEELIAKKIYYNSHEGGYHFAIGVTYFGDQVTLEDGSVWNVASWDNWKTLNWLTTDTILVMQNKWLFSSYKFMLVNQNTGKEVEVNLFLGPVYTGVFTHWIVGIDYIAGTVVLEDGSVWQMDYFDYSIMKKWLINDTVIIGTNELGSILNPNILINVNMLNYSRGICLN